MAATRKPQDYTKIKNHTTSITIEKTIGEIEIILSKHGITHIFKMYNDKGTPIALAFKAIVRDRELSFKLPMEEEKILQVFKNQVRAGKLANKYSTDIDQARRTGWRIIKNWIESQLALIEINLVTIDQIFLPYVYDQSRDKTMYELIQDDNYKLLE